MRPAPLLALLCAFIPLSVAAQDGVGERGSGEFELEQGVMLADRGRDVEALRWYRQAAEKGNAAAMNNIGMHYLYGDGVEPSHEEARRWLLMSAERGDRVAQYNLANLFHTDTNFIGRDSPLRLTVEEAARWYCLSARQGEQRAIPRCPETSG